MSIITGSAAGSFSSGNSGGEEVQQQQQQELLNHANFHGSNSFLSTTPPNINSNGTQSKQPPQAKRKRNLPGTPDPSAEVVALSPKTLMATNRFVCEICKKGFQRDQNLQLHRRGHNLPWKLKQRTSTEIIKRVYVCPEPSCVHHDPSRALGDLTGIKKHFCRKHGEKKWKCDKCSKKYAVQSDWKAHSKTCGTREYKCDCGTIFSRRDSFITHRAFCDAIAEENNTANQGVLMSNNINMGAPILQGQVSNSDLISPSSINNSKKTTNNPSTRSSTTSDQFNHNFDTKIPLPLVPQQPLPMSSKPLNMLPRSLNNNNNNNTSSSSPSPLLFELSRGHGLIPSSSGHLSATELLQKAAQMGATISGTSPSPSGTTITSMAPSTYGTTTAGGYNVNPFMQHRDHQNVNVGPQLENSFFGANNYAQMGMYGGLLFDPHQNNGLLKNMEQDNNGNSSKLGLRGTNVSGGDTLTVDFLGIGGSANVNRPEDFLGQQKQQHDQHQQQQQDQLGFGGIDDDHLRMQRFN